MKWRDVMCRVVVMLLLCIVATPLVAQDDDTEYRMEVGAGVGMHFGLNDVNSKFYGSSKLAGSVLTRFLLNPRSAVKVALNYGGVGGSTDGMKSFYPAHPEQSGDARLSYKAKGGLFDLCGLYEINFLPYGYFQGYQGFHRFVPYLQMGIGFTYSDAGDAFALNIPLGVGVKYKISRRLNLGLEWRMHFTMNDKLEGLEAPLGLESQMFRNKDHYSFTMLTLTYDIAPRCPTCNKD